MTFTRLVRAAGFESPGPKRSRAARVTFCAAAGHPLVYYSKNLLPDAVLSLLLQLVSAAVFVALEGWDYGDAMYHCLVTATTVGYGDISISTEAGKIWATFHILLSVCLYAPCPVPSPIPLPPAHPMPHSLHSHDLDPCLNSAGATTRRLGQIVTSVGVLKTERQAQKEKMKQLSRKLGADLCDSLMTRAQQMRSAFEPGLDSSWSKDTPGLTEFEFVLAMLLELSVVTPDRIRPFSERLPRRRTLEDAAPPFAIMAQNPARELPRRMVRKRLHTAAGQCP